MSEQRLSKLQRGILEYLLQHKLKYPWSKGKESYFGLKTEVARTLDKNSKTGYAQGLDFCHSSENFNVVFSQSLRNLAKKGLVVLTFCYQEEHWTHHRIKTCEGRKPESHNPCLGCEYLKKFNCEEDNFLVENGKCYFGYYHGYNGEQGYKQHISQISITNKGEELLNLIMKINNKNKQQGRLE